MKRLTTKLFVVALTTATLALAGQADAGGCHSGGGRYGGIRGSHFPSYRKAPTRRPVVYSSPRSFAPQPRVSQQLPPQQPQVSAPQGSAPQARAPQGPAASAPSQAPARAPSQSGLGALGQTQAPAAGSQQSAEQTALQALANLGGTQPAQAAPQQQAQSQSAQIESAQPTSGRVGTWVAKVGDKATVRLDLRANGTFTWTATRDGKSSDFQGQYQIEDGQMTLTRGDNQRLAGSLTSNANGFNFKLNGAKDNGLNFARS